MPRRLSREEEKKLRADLADFANLAKSESKKTEQTLSQDDLNNLVALANKWDTESRSAYTKLRNNGFASEFDSDNRNLVADFQEKVETLLQRSDAAAAPGGSDFATESLEPVNNSDKFLEELADQAEAMREINENARNTVRSLQTGNLVLTDEEIAQAIVELEKAIDDFYEQARNTSAQITSSQQAANNFLDDIKKVGTAAVDVFKDYQQERLASTPASKTKRKNYRRTRSRVATEPVSLSPPAPPSSPLRLSAAAQGIVVMSASESIQSVDRQGAIAEFRHNVLYESGLASKPVVDRSAFRRVAPTALPLIGGSGGGSSSGSDTGTKTDLLGDDGFESPLVTDAKPPVRRAKGRKLPATPQKGLKADFTNLS